MDQQDFYTIEEIAAQLRVKVSAIRRRLTEADPTLPPSIRMGGRRLFPATAYENWKAGILQAVGTTYATSPATTAVGTPDEARGKA